MPISSSKSKSTAKWTITYQLSLYCQFILTIAPAETKIRLGQNVSLWLLQLWMLSKSKSHHSVRGCCWSWVSSHWHLFSPVRAWDQLGAALSLPFSHLWLYCISATADRKHVKGIFEVFSSSTEILLPYCVLSFLLRLFLADSHMARIASKLSTSQKEALCQRALLKIRIVYAFWGNLFFF